MEIGIRELRADLATFVRRAAAGESIVVTQHGRPLARLGPLGDAAGHDLAELIAHGALVAPRTRPSPTALDRERLPVDVRSEVELRKLR